VTTNPSRALKILNAHEEVAYYLKKIIEQLHPEKVILFGSKAKGEGNQFSDTDMAVIGVKHFDTTQIFGAVDIVQYENAPESLKEKINNEGIVLYEKGNRKAAG